MSTEAATDTSFEAMAQRQAKVADIIRKDPAVDYVNSTVGAGADQVFNNGRMFVVMKPKKERDPLPAVIQRLRRATAGVAGTQTYFVPIQKHQYRWTHLEGGIPIHDAERRYQSRFTGSRRRCAASLRRCLNSATSIPISISAIRRCSSTSIARRRLYGITVDQIRQELYNAYGSRQVATIYTPSNDYQVILETLPKFQEDPAYLSKLRIKTANGQFVPQLELGHRLIPTVGPLLVNHQGQQPSVTISLDTPFRASRLVRQPRRSNGSSVRREFPPRPS